MHYGYEIATVNARTYIIIQNKAKPNNRKETYSQPKYHQSFFIVVVRKSIG